MIITETAKPQAACVRNLGARAEKTDPGLNSPETPLTAMRTAEAPCALSVRLPIIPDYARSTELPIIPETMPAY